MWYHIQGCQNSFGAVTVIAMSFHSLTIQNSEKPLKNIFAHWTLILLAAFMLAAITSPGLWSEYTGFYHTALELGCVFIALSSFLTVWHNYHRNPPINHLIGFGFLMVAVFDAFHTFYFPGLKFYPPGYLDLAARLWVLGRFTEAGVLLICSMNLFRPRINKWTGLLFSTALAAGSSLSVLHFPGLMPVLLTEQGLTPAKIAMEYVIISMFLYSLYKLKNKVNSRDILTYRYIFLALLIAVPAEVCFIFFDSITSFYMVLGHILKITYYYYLFRGIFVSAVTYPHEKLEYVGRYMAGILNGLPIGLITYDSDLRVSFVNRKALELSGLREEEMTGLHADQLAAKLCGRENGNSIVRQLDKASTSIKNKLKTIKSQGGPLKIRIDAQRLEGGGALVLFTEAKKEQQLESLQLQTRAILNSLSNIVIMVDKSKRIIMCNRAFESTFEMGSGDVLGKSLEDLFGLVGINRENSSEFLPGEAPGEASMITAKGNKKELVIHSTPITDLDGEVIGGIVMASDVTALKKEQERLQQREKLALLGEMAAGVVHEIKNPLTTIKGFSQIIASRVKDENLRKYACLIENTANEVNKVVSDFLSFARPRPPAFKEISVNKLVQSIKLMLESHLFRQGVDLTIDLSAEEKPVLVDDSQIRQVILNMVNNSVEAMNGLEKPRLTIRTVLSGEKDEMAVTISDNGKGMTPEEKLMAGTPFFTTKDKGTGLGLSICYQIVNKHGGRISVDSKTGKGTSFTISLPCKRSLDRKTVGPVSGARQYSGPAPGEATFGDKNLA